MLIAFVRREFVERLQWLTDAQVLDAVAVGQATPGPVFTTATFIGYVTHGWVGGAVATAGIFLPSFVFVGLTYPLVPRLRSWSWTAAFLDGVNAAAVALMAGVTFQLGREVLADALAAAIALAALAAVLRTSWNSAWLILAGAVAGLLRGFASGQ